jgi:hypothetical protein
MSSATPQQSVTALTTTGRRRRFERAHPYPELPRSRLPFARALVWLLIASIAALLRFIGSPIRRRLARRHAAPAADQAAAARRPESRDARPPLAPRVPSLTPY